MRAAPLLLSLAAAVVLVPTPVRAQQVRPAPAAQPIEISADGTELFRALLDRAGIKPVSRTEVDRGRGMRWDDVIVVSFGDHSNRSFFQEPINYLHNAVNNGGAALAAADTYFFLGHAKRPNGIEEDSAAIQPARVEARITQTAHPAGENWPFCPYAVPIGEGEIAAVRAPGPTLARVFGGDPEHGVRPLTRVATNSPSYITVGGFTGEWRFPLARFPRGAVTVTIDNFGRRFERPVPSNALFAIGSYGPDHPKNNLTAYHFLAVADHSVFINQMLLEPGTDNLELSYRAIEFLQGPTKRKRCLFLENGRIVERFDELRQAFAKSKPPSPIPNISREKLMEMVVDKGNQLVDNLQENEVPNKIAMGPDSRPEVQNARLAWLVKALLVIGAVYASWYLLRRMFALRKPTDHPAPPPVAAAATGPPGVFDRRQRELLRRDNVYEPVRDLVREFFTAVGIHGTEHGPKLPKLVISDEVRRPESLRAALKDFWKLAYGPPQEVTIARWRELEPYFERLRDAHGDGKWRFALATAAAV